MDKINLPNIKHIVAVASGKGGVGKSTVTMNLAVALAKKGLKVGLLDADIYGPSQPRMLGVPKAEPESDGKTMDPVQAHGVKMMSMGFLVDEETPTIWRGPMVQSALIQMLTQVNWGKLDILLVDMPPGTGDTQLSLSQKTSLSGAIIVSTPQDIALIDARKGLKMFEKVNVPILGMVENMSVFVCPHCAKETHIFGKDGAKKEAKNLGVELLAKIPLDLDFRKQTDNGTPVMVSMPDSLHTKEFTKLADTLWQKLQASPAKVQTPVKIVIE